MPNEAKLKDGSLQQALPNAQVTTCTYKPLVGVTSITEPDGTTPYYEYDGLGRLTAAYILNDGIKEYLQDLDYHYANQ
jgi:YD repeat-containing protein